MSKHFAEDKPATEAVAVTLSSGLSFGIGYDYYGRAHEILSW